MKNQKIMNTKMKIGKISKNEKMIKFNREIHCTSCGKQVPGGLKTGEKYYQSDEFEIEFNKLVRKHFPY